MEKFIKYKTFTFRAYPNKSQTNLIYLTFIMCRYMFNTLLSIELENLKKYNNEVEKCLKSYKYFDDKKFAKEHKMPKISKLKNSNENYKKVDSLAICAEYSNLVRGMELFYRGKSNLPKFKGRNDKHSYTTSQVNNNIRIVNNKIRLPKVGFIKVRGMREIPSNFKIKRAIIFEDKKGKFFISIVFEYEKIDKNDDIYSIKNVNTDLFEVIFDVFTFDEKAAAQRVCKCLSKDEACLTCLREKATYVQRYKAMMRVRFQAGLSSLEDVLQNPYFFNIYTYSLFPVTIQNDDPWHDIDRAL